MMSQARQSWHDKVHIAQQQRQVLNTLVLNTGMAMELMAEIPHQSIGSLYHHLQSVLQFISQVVQDGADINRSIWL